MRSLKTIHRTRFLRPAASALQTARAAAATPALLTALALAGCGESHMTMDGTLKGEMKGDLNGSLRLDGPVQIQMEMRGPTVRYDGVYISDKLLERVEVGKTTTDWLLAVFGEPTGKATLRDSTEIWKWAYRPLEQEGSVISVFSGGTKDEPKLQPSTAFLRIRADLVIEKWRD